MIKQKGDNNEFNGNMCVDISDVDDSIANVRDN